MNVHVRYGVPLYGWLIAALSLAALPAGAASGTGVASAAALSPTTSQTTAHDLGSLPGTSRVSFTLELGSRHEAQLQTLVSAGTRVSSAAWDATYGPDPAAVARARAVLSRAGLSSTWVPGDSLVTVGGPARAVERFLHVRLDRYILQGSGTTSFYAPERTPAVPKSISRWVTAVVGPSDYPHALAAAIPHSEYGISPAEATSFYDLTPLRKAGLDGTGTTVVFLEATVPPAADLAAYAKKFDLPPFDVKVRTDPSAWGAPETTSTSGWAQDAEESALDLEVVHGLAPGAREVAYEFGDDSAIPAMVQAMIRQNPDAVLTSSYSMANCERSPGGREDAQSLNAVFEHAAAQGTTIYFASGDRGAFACLPDGIASTEQALSVDPDVDSPYITGVGGTSAFLASNGSYYKEAAWGEPLETWGSGGGLSGIFKQPSYQVAPGLGANALPGRGVPDVACDADNDVSGWDIFEPPESSKGTGVAEYADGGTSAAAPCWAGITALIDEDLLHKKLPEVGFANPALYDFARVPAGLPALAFHPVTEGSNFHFLATAGWNPATGLGTPDAAHLADDFEWYERSKV